MRGFQRGSINQATALETRTKTLEITARKSIEEKQKSLYLKVSLLFFFSWFFSRRGLIGRRKYMEEQVFASRFALSLAIDYRGVRSSEDAQSGVPQRRRARPAGRT